MTNNKLLQVIQETIARTPACSLDMQLFFSVSKHITGEFAKALAVASPETSAVLTSLHKRLIDGLEEE